MIEIKAYKSNDGKLFEDKSKCLSYEQKKLEYPKKTVEVIEVNKDITYCIETIQERYRGIKTTTRYFKIKDMYTVYVTNQYHLLNFDMLIKSKDLYNDFTNIDLVVVDAIIQGNDLTEDLCKDICEKFNSRNTYFMMSYEIKPCKNGIQHVCFEDKRWIYGRIIPYKVNVVIES